MYGLHEPSADLLHRDPPQLIEAAPEPPPPDRLAEAALYFHESLDLPVVLDRVAQRIAALCGGVCQVRLTADETLTAHRAIAAAYGVADSTPAAPGNGEPYSSLLALLRLQPGGALVHHTPAPSTAAPAHRDNTANGAAHQAAAEAALLIAPLIARGRRIGTIDLLLPAPLDTDLNNPQHLLHSLATHAALALDTAASIIRQPTSSPTTAPQAQALEALLARLSHDLRSPLTAVDSSVQLLDRALQNVQELDRKGLIRMTALAKSGITQLKTQIDALSRPAQVRTPCPPPQTAPPIDLVTFLRVIAHFYQQTTSRHQIIVVDEVSELNGHWAQVHLERMFGNLLDNGIKYSPEGGTIRITISRNDSTGGSWAIVTIADTGIGIPQADLAQIAEHGYRAHNVGAIPGTGFGLSSVRELVEYYAGTFAIVSPRVGATTMQIRLPLT